MAEKMRENAIVNKQSFTFETVMSTDRNINIFRVESREAMGGHGVPEDKIRSRYEKALALIPKLVNICDVMHIYDNSSTPFRVFKKRKMEYFYWENDEWSKDDIKKLVEL